jgi:hypothetical protein
MKKLAIRMDYQTVLLLPAEAVTMLPQVEIVTSQGYNDWDTLHQAPDRRLDFRLIDSNSIGPAPNSEAEKEAERQALRDQAQALLAQAEAI